MTDALPAATHLVQLLLPLNDNDGKPFAKARFDAVRAELVERFGGVTAYVRSPAVGAWENDDGAVCRDDVILFEVMVDGLDRAWWRAFREKIERAFEQDAILVRATHVESL